MIYLLIAIFLFIASFIQTAENNYYNSKTSKLVLFLVFWLLSGLAWETGVDWYIYTDVYKDAVPLYEVFDNGGFYASNNVSAEFAYVFISSLVKVFTDEYQILQIVLLLITTIFFFKALFKYTTNYYASLLLYLGYVYLTLNMSGIRQAVALSIIFYSIDFILQKRFWKFSLYILLASLFHASSLVMLPLYFILNRRWSSVIIYTISSIGLVLYVFKLSLVTKAISTFSEYSGNPFLLRVWLYITQAEDIPVNISPKVILHIILLFAFIYWRKNIKSDINVYNIFLNLFTIYVILSLYFWDTGDVAIRLQHYFVLGLVIVFPLFMMSFNRLSNRVAILILIFMLSIWSSNPIFLGKTQTYNPYQNYIIYKIFNIESTGKERRDVHVEDNS